VGRLLVHDLRGRGHRVVSLVRTNVDGGHADDVAVQLADADAVRYSIAGARADVVVHLASLLRGEDLETVNERIDLAVTEGIREAGIRHVVLASSGAVYGAVAESPRSEESPLDGDSSYARSKVRSERVFRTLADEDDAISVTALRIFNVAGSAFTDSLVHRLIHAEAASPVRLTAPDCFIRDYIHQDDLIEVFRAAIGLRIPGARVVNVGAGAAVSTRMLVDQIHPDRAAVVEMPGDPSVNWADISKMMDLFGVLPRAIPDRTWA
jgi:nucleoside-diphosphate-sugar epimerase